jgi:hypothetical protein
MTPMPRDLPSAAEASRILSAKRTRPARRAPASAGRGLTRLIKRLDERFGAGPESLQARWREIVGENLAARTEPVKLSRPRGGSGGVLELRVDGPAATLIQHQAPELLMRVNLFLGAGSVERLRIVQGVVRRARAVTGPAQAAQARRRRAQPLDAGLEAELVAGLGRAPEGPLKTALLHLGREVLRRKPGSPS